jgi:hypothetical protein
VWFAVSASWPAASCSGLYPGQRPGLHLPGAAGHLAGEPGRAGPGQIVLLPRPASRAGRQNGGTPLHYDGRAAGAAVKAETRMAGDVMLPPGTAAEIADRGRFPTPGRPATRTEIIAGAGCCPVLPDMRLPQRGVSVVRLAWRRLAHTGAPDRLAGGDQTGQVLASLDPASRGVPL